MRNRFKPKLILNFNNYITQLKITYQNSQNSLHQKVPPFSNSDFSLHNTKHLFPLIKITHKHTQSLLVFFVPLLALLSKRYWTISRWFHLVAFIRGV